MIDEIREATMERGTPDRERHRKLRQEARKYEKPGMPWTRETIVKGNFPAPYENINGMTVAEVCEYYGGKVHNIISIKGDAATPEMLDRSLWAQMDQDEKYCTKVLYDPHAKENISFGAFVKKYGTVEADKAEDGIHYDYETTTRMKSSHEKWLKQNDEKLIAAPVQPDADKIVKKGVALKAEQIKPNTGMRYFLKTKRGIINNPEYRNVFKEKGFSIVFEYMWAHIVRKGWIDTPDYPIKERYYDKGFLAFCSSYRHLARQCGLDKNYTHKVLREMNSKGIVKLEMLIPKGKKFGQLVAVLGRWQSVDNVIEERLYRDKIFMPEQENP